MKFKKSFIYSLILKKNFQIFHNIEQILSFNKNMNFCSLSSKKCIPCETKIPPLNNEKIEELKKQLHPDWKVIENKKLQREWIMKDFKSGIQFFQDIMKIGIYYYINIILIFY
jgi:hypothetical protein